MKVAYEDENFEALKQAVEEMDECPVPYTEEELELPVFPRSPHTLVAQRSSPLEVWPCDALCQCLWAFDHDPLAREAELHIHHRALVHWKGFAVVTSSLSGLQ